MSVEIDFRPMQTWHGKEPEFRPGRWKNGSVHTMAALADELARNEIDNVLLETYHARNQLKINGLPKADERPTKPGVQLWFQLEDGTPICLSCNRFEDWIENVKALQMTLRSRRLERDYGCANLEEQYRGHAQLPAGSSDLTTTNSIYGHADFVIKRSERTDVTVEAMLADAELFHEVYKLAAKNTHPDRGRDGSEELMTALNNSKQAILASKGW